MERFDVFHRTESRWMMNTLPTLLCAILFFLSVKQRARNQCETFLRARAHASLCHLKTLSMPPRARLWLK